VAIQEIVSNFLLKLSERIRENRIYRDAEPRVGDVINNHVIARIHEFTWYWDCDVINRKTSERGDMRIFKRNGKMQAL